MPNMPQMDRANMGKSPSRKSADGIPSGSAPKFPRKRGQMKSTGKGPMGKSYEHSTCEGQTRTRSLSG